MHHYQFVCSIDTAAVGHQFTNIEFTAIKNSNDSTSLFQTLAKQTLLLS